MHVEHIVVPVFEFAPAGHRGEVSCRVDRFAELAKVERSDHEAVVGAVDHGEGKLGETVRGRKLWFEIELLSCYLTEV